MNRRLALIVATAAALLIAPRSTSAAAPTITSISDPGTIVGQYEKYELTFQISRQYPANSFLPYYYYDPSDTPPNYPGRQSPYGVDGITIDAHFIAPSGEEKTVPAFYFQDYIRSGDTMTPTSDFAWKIRFAPQEIGEYAYYITLEDRDGTSRYPVGDMLTMESAPSESRGFVRQSPRDSRFLEFSNGESFIPNSSGAQWWEFGERTTYYEQTFEDFKDHNINFFRLWDQNDGFALTVEGHFDVYTYPDDYSLGGKDDIAREVPKGTQMNQRGNYEEDIIIEAAARNGVYLVLSAHGDSYWIWDASVYKEGWNDNPVAFDDPLHLNYWKRNFRYRVARWGYSPAIVAWETWNEHEHVSVDSSLYRFYQAYGDYQQQTDLYMHLRTTSQGSQTWSPALWASPAFDYASYHDYMMISRYPPELTYDAANFVYRFAQCLRLNVPSCDLGLGDGTAWEGNAKPIYWGELDTGTTQWNEANPAERATHDMRWVGLFSPIGMSPIEWYYNAQSSKFVAKKYNDAKIAGDFFADIDYAGAGFSYESTADMRISSDLIDADNSALRVLGMTSEDRIHAYAWAQNRDNALWNTSSLAPSISANFTLTGMLPGTYHLEYWNTEDGTVITASVVSSEGNVTIPVSNLVRDVAIKIRHETYVNDA